MYKLFRVEDGQKVLIAVCRDIYEAAKAYEEDRVEHMGVAYTIVKEDSADGEGI